MATSSPEVQGKHDAHAFKKGGDNQQALQHVSDQAHSMSSKDLKSEQAYWNSLGKASHDHLPGLSIHRNKDGNVDSVKQGDKDLYNRDAEVQKVAENATGKLKAGQGPFQAFKEAGMSDREASKHAQQVMEQTGRTTFKQGEKLAANGDGSASITTEKNGVATQEKFKDTKHTETKVTDTATGDSKTTRLNDDGSAKETVQHKNGDKPGNYTDTTYQGDGSTNKRTEETKVDGDTATTKKFNDQGVPTEQTVKGPNGTDYTKFQANGVLPEQTVHTDANGHKTTTNFEAGSVNPKDKHQDTADGYVDTKYKSGKDAGRIDSVTTHTGKPDGSFSDTVVQDGKQVSKIQRDMVGDKGGYKEKRDFADSPTSTARTVDIERGDTNATGGFGLKRTERRAAIKLPTICK